MSRHRHPGHRHRKHRAKSLYRRLALIWFIGAAIVVGASTAIYFGERSRVLRNQAFEQLATDVVTVVWLLDAQPAAARPASLARLQAQRPNYQLALAPLPAGGTRIDSEFEHPAWLRLARELGERPLELRVGAGESRRTPRLYLGTRLADGAPFHVSTSAPIPSRPAARTLAAFAILLGGLAVVTWIAVRIATRPVRRLAQAAQALGEDLDRPPLPEDGPAETQQASRAFNRMQARIRELFAERTRIIAAVTHDLQTPITRLRLRAEMLTDESMREKTLADLAEMQSLVEEGLAYARSLNPASEPITALRLDTLIESLVADYHDSGRPVRAGAIAAATVDTRPQALRRLLSNLIDNALKFATNATVSLREEAHAWVVAVADDGPGIPEAELERVFEPFYRLETSRNRASGGTGLGLTIVRQLARSIGAEVRLQNRSSGGLEAEVRIARGVATPP